MYIRGGRGSTTLEIGARPGKNKIHLKKSLIDRSFQTASFLLPYIEQDNSGGRGRGVRDPVLEFIGDGTEISPPLKSLFKS